MGAAIATTPTFTLTHNEDDLDWTQVSNMYLTFQSGTKKLRKEGADLIITPNSISVLLTQEDTLFFGKTIYIQANWTYPGGLRGATKIVYYNMDEQLEKEILE